MTRYVLCRKSTRPGATEEYLYIQEDFVFWTFGLEANCLWALPDFGSLLDINRKPGYDVYWRPVTLTLGGKINA
jgi:hypothetical protein